jgi:hypothetical protein
VFDNLITQCQEMIRPHAIRVGNTAEAYAQRIVARLDAIVDELQDDGPERFATDTARRTPTRPGTQTCCSTCVRASASNCCHSRAAVPRVRRDGVRRYHTDPSSELNLIHVFSTGSGSPTRSRWASTWKGARIVVRFVGQPVGQQCTARLKMKLSAPWTPGAASADSRTPVARASTRTWTPATLRVRSTSP